MRRLVGLGIGAGLVAPAACAQTVFGCSTDEQCGAGGVCEAVGFCSFEDEACESGRRFAPLSGDGLGGTCVPEEGALDDSSSNGGSGTSTGLPDTSGTFTTTTTSSSETTGSASTHSTVTTEHLDVSTQTGDPTGGEEERVLEGLLVLYRLDEGTGSVVHDTSGFDAPIDVDVGAGFSWTASGLHSDGTGIALAQGPPTKIAMACQATNELTIETWITPDFAGQPIDTQPSRIVTWSLGSSSRNFMLGQGIWRPDVPVEEGFSVRLRTSDSTENGQPQLEVETTVPLVPQHLVYTRSSDGVETLYRDAEVIGTLAVKTGDFSTWTESSDHELALGNEVGNLTRGWAGELHLVAIYGRALSEAEVAQNLAAGY